LSFQTGLPLAQKPKRCSTTFARASRNGGFGHPRRPDSISGTKAAAELKGQYPAPSHADQTIVENTVVIAPDGSITAVYLKQRIDAALYNPAYEMWNSVDELPSNRATAVGTPSLPRVKDDGSLSPRHGVPENVLAILEEQGVCGRTMLPPLLTHAGAV